MDTATANAEIVSLLKLGSAFMASAFMMMGAAYAVRAMVLQWDGAEAAGYYQAAWTVGGLYVGIILQAMGADFYPRLTGAAHDDALMNRLVNEQTQVGLLLAAPGVIATLAFAPLAILVLYSSEFGEATEVLRWICLGMALRVISWPMGYTILAKGAQGLFFVTEFVWTVVNVGLAAVLIPRYGVNGAGIAFFGSYLFHLAMIYGVSRWLTGFRWSPENARRALYFTALVALIFGGFRSMSTWLAHTVGALVLLGVTVYCLRQLIHLVDEDQIPRRLRGMLACIRRSRPISPERGQ
jgi:PST family polysaccharide transporter